MAETYTARVHYLLPEAERQFFLSINVPPEVSASHIQPAQFVKMSPPDQKPVSITIANRPGRERFEFLVKDQGERSHGLVSLNKGDELNITTPMGPGFPISQHKGKDIILGANGVAVSAVRAVIEEILLARSDYGKVAFFYGERTGAHFAFLNEHANWVEGGIQLHLCASRPVEGGTWQGPVGYIQDNIERVAPEVRNTVAFIVGSDNMMTLCRETLGRMGLPPNEVYLNY